MTGLFSTGLGGDMEMTQDPASRTTQTAVGFGVLLHGVALAVGATGVTSTAGYGGVGPNFVPWLSAIALTVCGVLIIREARTGGFREMDPPSGAERGHWGPFIWISAGLLANAALITQVGFILSCTLCYLLAVQGLRRAAGQAALSPRTLITDVFTGLAISAPVFWAFTKLLAINLPGLTKSGWL
jgi:putative tricarboxylic transport membrane protein